MRIPVIGLLTLAAPIFLLHGEIIDRVAVAVGKQVITSSQIDTEVRVTAFLNGGGTDADPVAARKKAAGRLIDQTLIRREIDLTRFPMPKPEEAAPLLEQAKAVHGDGYANALKAASLSEDDVAQHLLWQLTFLRFVQYRFQPGVSLTDNEVRDFYNQQSSRFKAQGKTTPAFEAIRKDLETILTQRYVDEALDRWLAEQRAQAVIVFRLKGLEP